MNKSASKEYVHRVEQGQNDIYYITDESIPVVSSPLFGESSRKKGHEELYVADPVDEYDVQQPKESDGTKPNDNDNLELFKADDDNKKTYCLVGIDREKNGDTSLAIDTKSHGSAITDPTEQLTATEERLTVVANVHVGKQDVDNDIGHLLSVNTDVMNDDITQQVQKQQQHWHSNHSKQAMQRREGKEEKGQEEKERGRKGEGERGQAGRKKEEEKEVVGERGKQVEKDVMDWTVVRKNKRQKKRTVQIFVKVNESKAFPLDVPYASANCPGIVFFTGRYIN